MVFLTDKMVWGLQLSRMVRILGGMVANRSAEMLVFSVDVEDRRWFASAFRLPQVLEAVLLAV
jgi:hypothetical protein